MGIDQKRAAIAEVYSGQAWKDKVTKMKDQQVAAIYNRFLNQGLLKEKRS